MMWRFSGAGGRSGVASVEFGVVMPVFALFLVAVVDLGRVVGLRMRLEADVAAVGNYAITNAAQVNSANGTALAGSLAQLMGGNVGSTLTSGKVIVNNGPTVTVSNGGTTPSGTSSSADSCYCPSGTASPWSWGGVAACGSSCVGGLLAGKFVSVTETVTYLPLFPNTSFLASNAVSANAMVQVQ